MDAPGQWVLLTYRLPGEPSTPRITVWRKLEGLGVARLGDGLVGLPADSRTREHFDWLAEEIGEAGGTATVWLATPASTSHERALAQTMQAARAAEYRAVIEKAQAAVGTTDEPRRVQRGCAPNCGGSNAATSSRRPSASKAVSRWLPWVLPS